MTYQVEGNLIFDTAGKVVVICCQMASSALFNTTSLVAAINQNSENSGSNAK